LSESTRRSYQLRKLSKFLSLLLRHHPTRFPINMDAQGFAEMDEVMRMVRALPNFRWVTRADIDAVLALPGRQRFEIVMQGAKPRIRALYGHTALRPEYEPVTPPDVLYHGTAPEMLEVIGREGIRPMERQYVHLTPDPETARSIALRQTAAPIILKINARAAYAQGQAFYNPTPEIYLTEYVAPAFLEQM
jgi:putative RNA 2'-phosphotransferase